MALKLVSPISLRKYGAFFFLLILMLALVPIAPVIHWLALEPQSDHFFSQPWRLFSGHLVHSGWTHLFLNLTNYVLLRLAFQEWLSNKKFFAFLCYSALVISVGLHFSEAINFYIGFSGILHGLLFYLLLFYWKKLPLVFSFILIFVILKVGLEQIFGADVTLVNVIGVDVVVDAHAWGLFSGLSFYLAELVTKNSNGSTV